jgi:TfoX/Sxy family transcriptional regulator of competence genes
MAKMGPAPRKAIEAFADVTRDLEGAEPRKMFGYNAAFVNGNLFASLHEVGMILRLPEPDRFTLLALDGAALFEPMPGRPMREYVVVPEQMLDDRRELRAWIERAFAYGSSLAPKVKKAKGEGKRVKTKEKGEDEKVGAAKKASATKRDAAKRSTTKASAKKKAR